MKRQPTEPEKIFANQIAGEGFISEIYKELLKLNNKDNAIKKLGKGDRHFSKEVYRWTTST